MLAPVLIPVVDADPQLLSGAPPLVAARACFVAVREGRFGALGFAAGDVLVCDGEARHGDMVVLVARGHGRPRLGLVHGTELIGDAGERCHRARWRPAGRLLAVARQRQGRWLLSVPDGVPRPPPELASISAEQLPLFGAAA